MAYSFDGTYERNFERATVPVTDYPFTMHCWATYDGASGQRVLISINDLSATVIGAIQFNRGGSNQFNCSVYDTAWTDASITGLSVDTWYACGGVFTSTTSRTPYIDGSAGTADTTSASFSGIDHLGVGAQYLGGASGGATHSGLLKEAAIWNVALTAAEMSSLAAGFDPRLIRPNALVFYAPLTRGLQDLTGAPITADGSAVSVATDPGPPILRPRPWMAPITPAAAAPSGGHGSLINNGLIR